MSIDFATWGSDYLTRTSAVVTNYPITQAGWFWVDNVTQSHLLMSVCDTASPQQRFELMARGDQVGDPVSAFVKGSLAQVNTHSSAGFSSGVWFHAAAVHTSRTSRSVYLDGVETAGAATDAGTVSSFDTTRIGNGAFPAAQGMDGKAAECGIWNVALTANEVWMLAKGISPIRVRPTALKLYLPLYSTGYINDFSGQGNDMSTVGTTATADHPPVTPSFGFDLGWLGNFTAAVAAGRYVHRQILQGIG